jgi:hypothetical protein
LVAAGPPYSGSNSFFIFVLSSFKDVEQMAEQEGFTGHAEAIRVRFKK